MIEIKQKRVPCCSRCKNHGLQVPTRGHLKRCQYEYCNCQKCQCTQARRIALNKDINQRRLEARANRILGQQIKSNESPSNPENVNSFNEMSANMEKVCKSLIHEIITNHGENSMNIFQQWIMSGN